MIMSLLQYCLSNMDKAGLVTPKMILFSASGRAFLVQTISMACSHSPRIALKPLWKSSNDSG